MTTRGANPVLLGAVYPVLQASGHAPNMKKKTTNRYLLYEDIKEEK
jgi:hypothetical protein